MQTPDEFDDLDLEDEDPSTSAETLPAGASDRKIENVFERGRLRVVQDRNDFFLPHVLDFIEGRSWGNLHPEYQRRLRWDNKKKSRLIESFIMNVPVPPVFLYENQVGRFEVMDGQQRLNAVVDFIKNRFELSGLMSWPSLNGRRFSDLPPRLRRGLERAKVSAITLMSDAGDGTENSIDLRAQVFERLNTGGERLNPQELRNSLYSGSFNELIIELSKTPMFTQAWDIPDHRENTLSDGTPTDKLKNDRFFKRMTDVEIVLRFFAFKNIDDISGSVRTMLDNTMKRHRHSGDSDVQRLRAEFTDALNLCVKVFSDQVFRIPGRGKASGRRQLSRPFFDAQMVVMHQFTESHTLLTRRANAIKASVRRLAMPGSESYELMVGRANTAAAVKSRIIAVRDAVGEVVS